ncbi:hypothetical protein RHGRI_030083 [Rhododendron griersonianum]|uniref:Uncharacterized protein n=1 Tax=Rhododendron griersonianum TaxID=479676 RepID=A0AAV6ILI8_9ERIC|nr:hypothetical protein RHGRI_030083 [Rhododendron griersonianum]
MYLAKDLDEVLAKVTPGALVVDDIDLTKISKPAKKTSRSEGPSSTSSLKRKGTQEVTKLESEETPKKKKRLQKLSEKKTPTEKVAAIAGRTRSSTKTSSPDQAESKETIHHAESTPTTEVKKKKTKTAPIKETQEEKETEKVEMEKSPSLVSSDSSPASLEATSEGPPVNPEHEASSQTPEKSRLSPFKPEPPTVQKAEIVEEEAEEDMEDFFKTAASLVQVSLSGISGDGSTTVCVELLAAGGCVDQFYHPGIEGVPTVCVELLAAGGCVDQFYHPGIEGEWICFHFYVFHPFPEMGCVFCVQQAHAHYSFGPLSFCLSINYLDRFLSVYELPTGKTWTVQLLAVACLSIAAKMEETSVPLTVDLQVGEPKFIFEGKTIRRMELLVMSSLDWKMKACTPCSFVDYFLGKINGDDQIQSGFLISRSIQLILSTIKGIDFLEFRPSEIAAAVAISVSGEVQAVDIDKAMSCFILVGKGRVQKCVQLIQDLALSRGSTNMGSASIPSSVPQSPIGVLDAACLSCKSDDITVGSCANSSHNSPDTKRRKLSQGDFKS